MNITQIQDKKNELISNFKLIETDYNETSARLKTLEQQLLKFAGAIELITSQEAETLNEEKHLGLEEKSLDAPYLEVVESENSKDVKKGKKTT